MLSPVRLSSVCRLSVTFVRPIQRVEIFGNFSSASGTLAIHWHALKILRRSSQVTPPSGHLNARGVVKYSNFSPLECCISETVQDRRQVSINRKSYMRLWAFDWYQNRWLEGPSTAKWLLFCVIFFTEFDIFRGVLRKKWNIKSKILQRHNYGQFTITMSCSKRLQRGRATPTAQIPSRFINSRLNAQYLPSYRLICYTK